MHVEAVDRRTDAPPVLLVVFVALVSTALIIGMFMLYQMANLYPLMLLQAFGIFAAVFVPALLVSAVVLRRPVTRVDKKD